METNESIALRPVPAVFRHLVSLSGLVLTLASIFSFLLLVAFDLSARNSNPYVGVLAYMVAPAGGMLGLLLIGVGLLLLRRQMASHPAGMPPPIFVVDLSRPRGRHMFSWFIVGSVGAMFLSVLGSYRAYHYTESVNFCGQTCHAVMKPEYTAYLHSPHARVSCTDCHIGPGAEWYVKAKISGLYQVYALLFNKYHRPIPTPIKNLRPAQQTCEECHWPKKFVGNLDRTYTHFLSDEKNTEFSVRLLLKVGGGDPTHGPVGGIHWHMNVENEIEYVATDDKRQVVPWVRVTDPRGVVTEYRTPGFTDDPSKYEIRRMDCMDCHNRPSHMYQSPSQAVDLALTLGKIDRGIPFIRREAVATLLQRYASQGEGVRKIAESLQAKYPNDVRITGAIAELQSIYRENFFPEMKASWQAYPNDLGHKEFPGCYRCHDGEHRSVDGKQTLGHADCQSCHVILAQGSGKKLLDLKAEGHRFDHPGGDIGNTRCDECHTGDNQ